MKIKKESRKCVYKYRVKISERYCIRKNCETLNVVVFFKILELTQYSVNIEIIETEFVKQFKKRG